jgi:hypothetical protein
MTYPRIGVPVLAAVIVFAIAHARAEDPPAPPDAARQNERYAILPGAESLFADMVGRGETLPGGCTFTDGKIERTSVLATYTCGDRHVVLQLRHPASAPSGGMRTERFAITVEDGAPPAGLVEAVADRVRAREAAFEWTEVGGPRTQARRWPILIAVGSLAAILALWARRRRVARRKH